MRRKYVKRVMKGKKVNCTGCGEFKNIDQFTPNARDRYGVNNRCKECCAAYQREYSKEK